MEDEELVGAGKALAPEHCVRCNGSGEMLNGYDIHWVPYWIKCRDCSGTGFAPEREAKTTTAP